MSHRNNNTQRYRIAVKALMAKHNISRQQAAETYKRSGANQKNRRSRRMPTAQAIAAVMATIDEAANVKLMLAVEDMVAAGDSARMDEFTPLDVVDGDIEQSTLIHLAAAELTLVEDAETLSPDGEPPRWGVHTRLLGVGDVEWHISAPSGHDVEFYGDSMGGDSGGPGLVHQIEPVVPVELQIWAEWDPAGRIWTDVEIQYISMPDDEVALRDHRHSDQETKRMQATGQLPSDEWIDKNSYPMWAIMDDRPRVTPQQLTKADVPAEAGVYAWYRHGKAIYVGKASSLQQRVWSNHLGRGGAMKSSAFRRNVADHLGIAAANDIKTGAYQPTDADLRTVRKFIDECAVAWITYDQTSDAEEIERSMKAEWMPELTRI